VWHVCTPWTPAHSPALPSPPLPSQRQLAQSVRMITVKFSLFAPSPSLATGQLQRTLHPLLMRPSSSLRIRLPAGAPLDRPLSPSVYAPLPNSPHLLEPQPILGSDSSVCVIRGPLHNAVPFPGQVSSGESGAALTAISRTLERVSNTVTPLSPSLVKAS